MCCEFLTSSYWQERQKTCVHKCLTISLMMLRVTLSAYEFNSIKLHGTLRPISALNTLDLLHQLFPMKSVNTSKGKWYKYSWICPFVRIPAKIKWFVSWPVSHPSTQFCGIPFSGFLRNPADKQTNPQTNKQSRGENITSFVEVRMWFEELTWQAGFHETNLVAMPSEDLWVGGWQMQHKHAPCVCVRSAANCASHNFFKLTLRAYVQYVTTFAKSVSLFEWTTLSKLF